MQAIVNDILLKVLWVYQKDIAAIVERGMAVCDAEYWAYQWQTRAVVWSLLPGASEGKPDPFTVMKDSTVLVNVKATFGSCYLCFIVSLKVMKFYCAMR